MDIKTFVDVVSVLPPFVAVLAKGPTGIGKSHIVHQVAKKLGYPVLDKRLAYMTEGDVVGLPELVDGVTRFAPVDWIVQASNEPVVLFLDELNRATMEVQQCAFQLVLDRELNGQKLHPETRVFVAINEGSDYQVTEMDPALLRRFWSTELEPTTNDWLTWASGREDIDPVIIEYISRYPAHLRHVGDFEPGQVYPNPASWHRLSQSLQHANLSPSTCLGENYNSIIASLSKGFIGDTTTVSFVQFLKDYKTSFNAADILDHYGIDTTKTMMINKLTNDKKNDLLRQVSVVSSEKDLTIPQVKRSVDFALTCSDEMVLNFYNLILSGENVDNMKKYNGFLGMKIVQIANSAESI